MIAENPHHKNTKHQTNPDNNTRKPDIPRSRNQTKTEETELERERGRERERLTRVKAERNGCGFSQELITKRARHACLQYLPPHFHHLTRHFLSLSPPPKPLSLSLYIYISIYIETTFKRESSVGYGSERELYERGGFGGFGLFDGKSREKKEIVRRNYVGSLDFGQSQSKHCNCCC